MSIIKALLKPYKILFKDSSKKPKEENTKPQEETKNEEKVKKLSEQTKEKGAIMPSEPRAGKILWKKKK